MHLMAIFAKEVKTYIMYHECGRTMCEWMLIGINDPIKGYNFFVLLLYLQPRLWVTRLWLYRRHFTKVILTFQNTGMDVFATTLQLYYNSHPMLGLLPGAQRF